MLDAKMTEQLAAYLTKLRQPITLVASLGDDAKSRELDELLGEIAALSDLISVRRDGDDQRVPSFAIQRTGSDVGVTFAGLPMGHEFTSLVLALLQIGGHPPRIDDALGATIRGLGGAFEFETYFSQSCGNCPDVVQALNAMAALNPKVRHIAIDGALFKDEVEARQVMTVPQVFLNGQPFAQGRMEIEQIVARLDTGAEQKAAAAIDAKQPFDMLVIGGGPAGAAAAIYAARKGIRTGLVTERFGGQVLDTAAIENLVSVPHTEGPRLAADLERHVREYEVDLINLQRVAALRPGAEGALHDVVLENGATLSGRSVILAPGARWRQMNVPGEAEYRTKGVTYCPHCDGPLFKGKRVAVIGGGNSGVEAAIDLAGVVAHVTLIEYDSQLRADAVLQRKLGSLENVTVITSALTTEVAGDGTKVTGLVYKDRNRGATHEIALEGVFVQIGLVPGTEWLKGTIALTQHGEIEIDATGATSRAGIFAAGDATTEPFKQIVVAMGGGSTAALSAFDYLIRLPAEAIAA